MPFGRVPRAWPLNITACFHLNPSMALASALAYVIQVHEAAAVVASGEAAAMLHVWRRVATRSGNHV